MARSRAQTLVVVVVDVRLNLGSFRHGKAPDAGIDPSLGSGQVLGWPLGSWGPASLSRAALHGGRGVQCSRGLSGDLQTPLRSIIHCPTTRFMRIGTLSSYSITVGIIRTCRSRGPTCVHAVEWTSRESRDGRELQASALVNVIADLDGSY